MTKISTKSLYLFVSINKKNIMEDKAKIFLDRILDRIDNGEFDDHLDIPFASRKLLKSLIESKMSRKVETHATPILSDTDVWTCVDEVRETAAYTALMLFNANILEKKDDKLSVSDKWEKLLNK